ERNATRRRRQERPPVQRFLQHGAAMESNHPTGGLLRPAGFEDRMGHQTPAAPRASLSRGWHPMIAVRMLTAAVLSTGKVLRHPQREGHDRERGVEATGGDENRPVPDEDVLDVVQMTEAIGDRGPRVPAYARGARGVGCRVRPLELAARAP